MHPESPSHPDTTQPFDAWHSTVHAPSQVTRHSPEFEQITLDPRATLTAQSPELEQVARQSVPQLNAHEPELRQERTQLSPPSSEHA